MKVGSTKKKVIVREYELETGKIQVYDNYMVSIFDEGATLTLERAYQIIGITSVSLVYVNTHLPLTLLFTIILNN